MLAGLPLPMEWLWDRHNFSEIVEVGEDTSGPSGGRASREAKDWLIFEIFPNPPCPEDC